MYYVRFFSQGKSSSNLEVGWAPEPVWMQW